MTFQDGFQQRKSFCVKGYECLLIYEYTDLQNVLKTIHTHIDMLPLWLLCTLQ